MTFLLVGHFLLFFDFRIFAEKGCSVRACSCKVDGANFTGVRIIFLYIYYTVFKLLSMKFTTLNTQASTPLASAPASRRNGFYHVAAEFDVLLSCKRLPSCCSLSLFGRLDVYCTVSLYGRELSHPECGRNWYFPYMSSCCLFDYILELNLSALESEPAEQAALTIYRSERTPPDRQRGEGRGAYSKDAVIFAPKDSLHAWHLKRAQGNTS